MLDLEAIKQRAEKATPGPWGTFSMPDSRGEAGYSGVEVEDSLVRILRLDGSYFDADFIAHARTDIPALVAEVERLRAERDGVGDVASGTLWHAQIEISDLQNALGFHLGELRSSERERDHAESEVARLQGIIDQVRAAAERWEAREGDSWQDAATSVLAILDGEAQS